MVPGVTASAGVGDDVGGADVAESVGLGLRVEGESAGRGGVECSRRTSEKGLTTLPVVAATREHLFLAAGTAPDAGTMSTNSGRQHRKVKSHANLSG